MAGIDLSNEKTLRAAMRQSSIVDDVHARLNRTRVARVAEIRSVADVIVALDGAKRRGTPVAVAGGRHAMGGQQFARDGILLDMRKLDRILEFDPGQGRIRVQAGIDWPRLMLGYTVRQRHSPERWGIRQKQTGADRLGIGGAIAANIHGRGLRMRPFVEDLISLTLVDPDGRLVYCSREENPQLFRLVVGGYGLFGIVVEATIQLAPRAKLERVVRLLTVDELMDAFDDRLAEGCLYGDFQFAIDLRDPDFLRRGVFSCYRPVDPATPIPDAQLRLGKRDWQELLYLAHTDKSAAFDRFADFYRRSDGQLYWSDSHQLSIYLDDYHTSLDRRLGACITASEVITELYVPRDRLVAFMDRVRADFRAHGIDPVYGTIRLIERDDETFLRWAKDAYACVIFNLHTEHSAEGLQHSATAFRRLIDHAIAENGSYYLTYHRYATREQVLACYPRFPAFLRAKRRFDPHERLQSDWYRHHRTLLADLL